MIVIAVRFMLGVILALAVLGKARNFVAFQGGLANFGLHGRIGQMSAFMVVTVEALAAVAAFSPAPALAVGVAGTCLGMSFTAAQTYLLVAGEQAPCLCFGSKEQASIRTWARAALVLLMGLTLWAAAI
ncbi:MauE/DoxX family redox-associated membrane protein [Streptosporangium sp. CA-135522]|uniref:MauE/DoxX family redox-associated membrane protein n=1 Tax=Streptosporangium sp. CA-135522 TaxID=3240072 RepID=UPI003D91B366